MFKLKFGLLFSTAFAMACLFSCGPGTPEGGAEDEDITDSSETSAMGGDQKIVYYATPSLVEIATIMKSSGASFTNELLNDPANSNNYSTKNSKAINLGIYGADLTYAAMFDHTQESIIYLKTVKNLAEDLGMTGAFESELLSNIESNISNRDSLLDIITDFYWSADAYLMDNELQSVATMIIAGGWIESMFIACHMASNSPQNKEIKKRIAEQKLILKNLISYVNSESASESDIKDIVTDLKGLNAMYTEIMIAQVGGEAVTDESKSETVIGNQTEVKINDDQLSALCSKLSEVRNKYVK